MENRDEDIKKMNKFLKGVHMGGTTFKSYLEKADSPKLKEVLQEIIESFKRHEEAITHRIEMLGGDAADSVGVMGMMGEFFQELKLIAADNDEKILEHAINAMNMGVEKGNKFLEENIELEESLKNDIKGVLKDYNDLMMKLHKVKL